MADSRYHSAQICLNGHIITYSIELSPEKISNYCQTCGAETIKQCQGCGIDIRGIYVVPGALTFKKYDPPSFCYNCGSPFPWTKTRLEAAEEFAEIQENLTPEEREILKKSINEIVKDTPKATVEANKFKRLVSKAGSTAAQGFRDILVDVISETAKKMIWPS